MTEEIHSLIPLMVLAFSLVYVIKSESNRIVACIEANKIKIVRCIHENKTKVNIYNIQEEKGKEREAENDR